MPMPKVRSIIFGHMITGAACSGVAGQESSFEKMQMLEKFGSVGGGITIQSVPSGGPGPWASPIPGPGPLIIEPRVDPTSGIVVNPSNINAKYSSAPSCELAKHNIYLLEGQFAVCNYSEFPKQFDVRFAAFESEKSYNLDPGRTLVLQSVDNITAVAILDRGKSTEKSFRLPGKKFYNLEIQSNSWVIAQPEQSSLGATR